MKKAYYARPVTDFGSETERLDINLIIDLGFHVLDITSGEIQAQYKFLGMNLFKDIIFNEVDALFFRSFEDGFIGAGVYKEIGWAVEKGIPVMEMPDHGISPDRVLSVDQTRSRLRAIRSLRGTEQ